MDIGQLVLLGIVTTTLIGVGTYLIFRSGWCEIYVSQPIPGGRLDARFAVRYRHFLFTKLPWHVWLVAPAKVQVGDARFSIRSAYVVAEDFRKSLVEFEDLAVKAMSEGLSQKTEFGSVLLGVDYGE